MNKELHEHRCRGDCRDDNLIDHIFGSVSEFARQIEEHGDEFIYQGIKVTYDPDKDIHYFYSRESC